MGPWHTRRTHTEQNTQCRKAHQQAFLWREWTHTLYVCAHTCMHTCMHGIIHADTQIIHTYSVAAFLRTTIPSCIRRSRYRLHEFLKKYEFLKHSQSCYTHTVFEWDTSLCCFHGCYHGRYTKHWPRLGSATTAAVNNYTENKHPALKVHKIFKKVSFPPWLHPVKIWRQTVSG